MANRITPTVHETHDRTEAGALPDANPVRDVATLRDGVYRAMQAAIDQYPGGVQQLAEELGAARSDTYLRVARKQDSKGNLQRAFLDFLAPLFTYRASALAFAAEINKLLDLEPPVPMRRAAADDIGRTWLKQLASLPPGEREGRITDMATALAIRPEDLRAMAGVR